VSASAAEGGAVRLPWLDLPARSGKPRDRGLTMAIDPGAPTAFFLDAVQSFADHVDLVKFGWGTAVVTRDIAVKAARCAELGIGYFLGGTLFERHATAGRVSEYLSVCRDLGCTHVEVSDGTLPMSRLDKSRHIDRCAAEFTVLSEVGYKDPARPLSPEGWVAAVRADLMAGAALVVTEARESGRAGLCTADGRLRRDVLAALLGCGVAVHRLLFEAPTKELQVELIRTLGPNVNLGNVALGELASVETLRLGLRADTALDVAGLAGDLAAADGLPVVG
jgi:phosphosulfolactate synthase